MKRSDLKNATNPQIQMLNEMKPNAAESLSQHHLISICIIAATKGSLKPY